MLAKLACVLLVFAVSIAVPGCGGGIEEGVPQNATYAPPAEQPNMKPVSSAEIQAKAKTAPAPAEAAPSK